MKIADSRNFKAAKNIAVAEVFVEVGGMRYTPVIWAVHRCWLNLVWTGSCMLVPLLVHFSHHWRMSIALVASYAAWVDIHYQRKGKNHSFCGTKQCEHVWFFRECRCIQLNMSSHLISSCKAGDVAYVPPSFGEFLSFWPGFCCLSNVRPRPLYRKYWGRAAQVPWGTQDKSVFYQSFVCYGWHWGFILDVFQDISLKQWLALTPHELVKAHLGFDLKFIDSFPKEKEVVVAGK